MLWPEVLIYTGILIIIGSLMGWLHLIWRRFKLAREQGTTRVEGLGEIAFQAALSGGLVLVSVTAFLEKASDWALPTNIILVVVSIAIFVFLFGLQLGRLFARAQLRRLGGSLDTDRGKIKI